MNLRTIALALVVGIVLLGAFWLYRGFDEAPPAATTPASVQPSAGTPTSGSPVTSANGPAEPEANPTPEAAERSAAAAPTRSEPTKAPFVRLRVLDPDTHPIAEATVETFDHSTAGRVATDADGWCTLPVRVDASFLRLRITAGMRHRQAIWQPLPELTITLPWVGALRGRLVDDATGLGVIGALVRLPHGYCKQCEPETTHSAQHGAFVFAAVPRNENCVFTVRAAGYPDQHFSLRIPGRGEAIEHTFRLLPGEIVAGRCIDLETKRAIAGATLRANGEEVATTAIDGGFRVLMRPSAVGTVHLEMAAPEYCQVTYEIASPQADGAIEYPLPRTVALSGSVRDQVGNPIPNAHVRSRQDYEEPSTTVAGMPDGCRVQESAYFLQPSTDAAGNFRIAELVPGRAYRVTAHHEDFLVPTGELRQGVRATARDGAPPVQLVLAAKPALGPSGVIVGSYRCDGLPKPGQVSWRGATRSGSARIEYNGTFRLDRVQAGTIALQVIAEQFQFAAGELRDRLVLHREVQLQPGEELRVELEQQLDGAPIRGRVTFTDGSAAAGRAVTGTCQRLYLRATADETGAYELRAPAFVANVQVSASGEPARRDVHPGAVGVDFVVPRNSTLRYRIVRADHSESYTRVVFRREGERYFSPIPRFDAPDLEGYCSYELPRGTYDLAVVADGMAPNVQTIVLGEQTATRIITLQPGTDVTLRLASDSKPWPEGLRLEFIDEALANRGITPRDLAGFLASRVFDLHGSETKVQGVAAGRHRLALTARDFEILPATIDVGTSPVSIEVRWQRRP